MSLGLPDHIVACPFDLDGVLTQTATVHEAAWKQMFDAYLQERAARPEAALKAPDKDPEAALKAPDKDPEAALKAPDKDKGEPFRAFEEADYDRYVDGKPRFDGVRS